MNHVCRMKMTHKNVFMSALKKQPTRVVNNLWRDAHHWLNLVVGGSFLDGLQPPVAAGY